MKVQYNSLTMLSASFMQEFGPISSRVYCIFAQITNRSFSSDVTAAILEPAPFTVRSTPDFRNTN